MSEFVARKITIANPTLLTEQFGIYVQGNCLVLNNTISRTVSKQPFRDFHKGIYVHSAKSYTLNNNKIDNLDRGIIMQNRSMVTGNITKNTLTDNYYGVTAERNNISTTSMYVQIRCNAFNNTWAAPSGSPLTIKRGIYIEPSTYLNNLGGCSTAINTRLIPCNNTYSSSAGSWLTIHNDNITSIDYYRASSENIIPFIGLTNIVCTISNSCSTSNINPTALEHISTGNTTTAQEANQYQQQLNSGTLSPDMEKPVLYELAGYYDKNNNTQGLETFRQTLATGSHSRNVLTEYLYYNAIDEADYTKAQAHKTELVQQNPNNTEIQDWGKHTTALEAINHISTPTNYTLAATERVLLEQVANNTVSLNMEACRRLNLHGIGANCTPPVNVARKAAKNTPEIDWSRLASNDSLNLVPNYSFEIYDSCTKEQGQGLIQFATGWKRFTDTPDYLNPCWDTLYPTSNPKYGVPDNIFAYSYPAHGNSYAHEIVYNNWYDSVYCDVNVAMSEKAGIMLKQSLKSGTKYYVGFMVKLARCGYATNKIGMRFTSNEWFNRCELDYGYDHLHTDSIITDSINWTPIAGSITTEIDSVYKYVVIGNFHYITQTDTIKIPQSGTIIVNPDRSTYLIDKIVVTEDSAYFYSMINGIKPSPNTDKLTGFKLYPNPATNTVTIEAPEQGRILFKDVLGRERLEFRTKMLDKQTIDISHLPTGVYIYEYRTDKGNTTGKLIIE